MTPQEFANALAEFGLTPSEFRRMTKIHLNTTWNWLNGRTKTPEMVKLLFDAWRENKELRQRIRDALDFDDGVAGD